MGNFAKVIWNEEKNKFEVLKTIVATQDFISTYLDGIPGKWIEVSYNTKDGEHPKGRPIRKNYPGRGYEYDPNLDAFIQPKPRGFDSWVLDEEKGKYKAPIPMPDDGKRYRWNEREQRWDEITQESK